MLKLLQKGKNCAFGLSQKTRNVLCMYLRFQKLKRRSKKSPTVVGRLKRSTNDVFHSENARWQVPPKLQLKPQKTAEIIYLDQNKQQRRFHVLYFRSFEVRKNVRLMFWRPKHSMKENSHGSLIIAFKKFKVRSKKGQGS